MKIVYYRNDCIGCNSCVEHAPDCWKISEDDGKVVLIDSIEKNGVFVKEISEGDLPENELAARDCPMGIIKIEGKE